MLSAEAIPYTLAFVRPVTLGGRRFESREGLMVRVHDGRTEGWGECAPLPGFSAESLDAVRSELRHAIEEVSRGHTAEPRLPSVRCGLEMAMADLHFNTGNLAVDLVPRARQSLNAVLLESEGVEKAAGLAAAGYTTIKIKVGGDPEADALRVRAVSDVWFRGDERGGATLRLDANQAWTLDEARRFAEGLATVEIEYIEEPTGSLADNRTLAEEGLPIALDESLRELDSDTVAALAWPAALILKPMMMGLSDARATALRALDAGVTPVISSSLESDVGLWGLARFAASIGTRDVPAGLGTSRLFAHNLTNPAFGAGPFLDTAASFSVRSGAMGRQHFAGASDHE